VLLAEPLKKENRKPFPGFQNPFGFIKLFGSSGELSLTSGMLVSQWFVEPKNIADTGTLIAVNQLNLSSTRLAACVSRFVCWGSPPRFP
jgi:hypothetical protein